MEYILKPVTAKELTDVLIKVHGKLDAMEKEHARLDKLTEAYSAYTKNKSAIISKNLAALVKGTDEAEGILTELRKAGLTFEFLQYRIAVLTIEDDSKHGKGTGDRTNDALFSFAVANICSEILENEQSGIAFTNEERQALLLLGSRKNAGFSEKAAELCRKCKETVGNVMHFDVSIGLGETVHSVRSLNRSFTSADVCRNYRYVLGPGYFIDYDREAAGLDRELDLTPQLAALSVSIKTFSHEKIAVAFEEIEKKMAEKKISENRCRLYLEKVYHTVSDTLKLAQGTGRERNTEGNDDQLDQIAKSRDLKEALTQLRSYAYECVQKLRSLISTNGELQAVLATDYLNEHYEEPGLSLNDLCSYLGISASHFSSLFKEYTGMTFMEKLTGIRVEKAKELLTSTNLRNYEISERVGYLDPHYFSIVFKKATGKSPSDYTRGNKV